MTAHLGAAVIQILETAGEHHLRDAAPHAYAALLLQIGGTDTVRAYDGSATYWERVQAILDNFFTSAQRAEVAGRLIDRAELRCRPECRGFLARALAERRMQELLTAASLVGSTAGPAGAATRRPR